MILKIENSALAAGDDGKAAAPRPAGSRGVACHPATPRGTPSHPLLAGTRALNPLPVDFSTLLAALPQERGLRGREQEGGQAAAALGPPRPAEPPVPVARAGSEPVGPPGVWGGPAGHGGQGQRLCAWPSLPRLVTCQPPLSSPRGTLHNLPILLPILEFLFLGGWHNFQPSAGPLRRRHPPSPGNASCRLWPRLCTPACSRRCWG